MMRVEEVREARQLSRFREEWQALVASSPTSDLFQTYEWLTSWLDCFWLDRPIAFLFVRQDERLVGLAPLVRDLDGALGCPGSLALAVNPHARRLDLIHSVEPGRVLDAVLNHLRAAYPRVRLRLRQSLERSTLADALPRAVPRHRMTTTRLAQLASPVVRLDGDWQSYLSSRSAHVQKELRRKTRKAERDWKVTWSVVSCLREHPRVMEEVLQIERRSWKEDRGTSFTAEAGLSRFYGDLAARFAAAGWLRIYLLHLNAVPVAHIFGAEYQNEYFALKTSYDGAYRDASPGQLLFQYALRDAFERKLAAFDFLGDESRWKKEMANDTRHHTDLCAFSVFDLHCGWCALRETRLKPLVRAVAPWLADLKRSLSPARHPEPARGPAREPPDHDQGAPPVPPEARTG
jgi:CelD/BcsL family acetyltransferase involved in cellulose biosynthesis